MSVGLLLLAATLLSATGGGVAPALAQQVPFAAKDGFTVEARLNASEGPRHPYGLSLVSVGEGPVLAVGERSDGFEVTVTAVAGGVSQTRRQESVPRPAGEDLARLRCRIGYDAPHGVVWFAIGEGPKAARVEFPAPEGIGTESYRIVPSQVPSALKVERTDPNVI